MKKGYNKNSKLGNKLPSCLKVKYIYKAKKDKKPFFRQFDILTKNKITGDIATVNARHISDIFKDILFKDNIDKVYYSLNSIDNVICAAISIAHKAVKNGIEKTKYDFFWQMESSARYLKGCIYAKYDAAQLMVSISKCNYDLQDIISCALRGLNEYTENWRKEYSLIKTDKPENKYNHEINCIAYTALAYKQAYKYINNYIYGERKGFNNIRLDKVQLDNNGKEKEMQLISVNKAVYQILAAGEKYAPVINEYIPNLTGAIGAAINNMCFGKSKIYKYRVKKTAALLMDNASVSYIADELKVKESTIYGYIKQLKGYIADIASKDKYLKSDIASIINEKERIKTLETFKKERQAIKEQKINHEMKRKRDKLQTEKAINECNKRIIEYRGKIVYYEKELEKCQGNLNRGAVYQGYLDYKGIEISIKKERYKIEIGKGDKERLDRLIETRNDIKDGIKEMASLGNRDRFIKAIETAKSDLAREKELLEKLKSDLRKTKHLK